MLHGSTPQVLHITHLPPTHVKSCGPLELCALGALGTYPYVGQQAVTDTSLHVFPLLVHLLIVL